MEEGLASTGNLRVTTTRLVATQVEHALIMLEGMARADQM